MKKCAVCLNPCDEAGATCPACGEASWFTDLVEAPKRASVDMPTSSETPKSKGRR